MQADVRGYSKLPSEAAAGMLRQHRRRAISTIELPKLGVSVRSFTDVTSVQGVTAVTLAQLGEEPAALQHAG